MKNMVRNFIYFILQKLISINACQRPVSVNRPGIKQRTALLRRIVKNTRPI